MPSSLRSYSTPLTLHSKINLAHPVILVYNGKKIPAPFGYQGMTLWKEYSWNG
jgi:hypothetical protein